MKSWTAICGAILFFTGSAGAEVLRLDSCEDTSYTRTVGQGESVELNSVTPASEGKSALGITYNFTASPGSWKKNDLITKTFPEPVDLSDMDALELDINITQAKGGFVFTVSLIDEKGYGMSADLPALFAKPTEGFRTISIPLAAMVTNEPKSGGRAVNLRKIKRISYNFPNQWAVAADSLSFIIDNVKVVHGLGMLKEVQLDNFESYANAAALTSDYEKTGGATSATMDLVRDNPRAGKQALELTGSFQARWNGIRAKHSFLMPIDLTKAKYIRFSTFGDAAQKGYNPMVAITLHDRSGNNLIGRVWGWGEVEEWSDIFLPFTKPSTSDTLLSCWVEDAHDAGGKDGNCNLSDIVGFSMVVEPKSEVPGGYPLTASVLFDNIIVGTDVGTEMNIVLSR